VRFLELTDQQAQQQCQTLLLRRERRPRVSSFSNSAIIRSFSASVVTICGKTRVRRLA
jgi:hypothetical protein